MVAGAGFCFFKTHESRKRRFFLGVCRLGLDKEQFTYHLKINENET